jgi:hypothetical protein
MRTVGISTLCLFLVAGQMPAAEPPKREHESLAREAFGKQAIIRAGAGATVGHIANRPHEWGRGPSGFGKRFGSGMGKHVVKSSVQFGVAALRHEDLKYYRSERQGFRPRMKHALLSTVVARKTTNGRPTMATGRVSGAVAGGFVSRLWQPARLHTVSSGLGSSGISLGADAGANVVREFWPEIRHPRRRR